MIHRLLPGIFCILLVVILSSCSKTTVQYIPGGKTTRVWKPDTAGVTTEEKLIAQYKNWKGTPYRNGGTSRRGVDCSGFVRITYRDLFGRDLPRTVEEQEDMVGEISASRRLPGDLVFFKTGLFSRHVGIWMGDGQFLHASSTRGVTISRLDSGYWEEHYWKSGRVQ